jgi:hypothetical protein
VSRARQDEAYQTTDTDIILDEQNWRHRADLVSPMQVVPTRKPDSTRGTRSGA